jgi:hypothetical protein
VVVQQANVSVVVEPLRVACRVRELSRQQRQTSAHEGKRQRLRRLAEVMDFGVQRTQLFGRCLLVFVHEDKHADPRRAGAGWQT